MDATLDQQTLTPVASDPTSHDFLGGVGEMAKLVSSMELENSIIEAFDGMEALERLRGENGYEKAQQQLVVLLDLNMPRIGGIEFLDKIRADPELLKQSPGRSFGEAIERLSRYWSVLELTDEAA